MTDYQVKSVIKSFEKAMGRGINLDTLESDFTTFLDKYTNPHTRKNKVWCLAHHLNEQPEWLEDLLEKVSDEEFQYRLGSKSDISVTWDDIIMAREALDHTSVKYLIISLFTMMTPLRKSEWNVYTKKTLGENYIEDKKLYIKCNNETPRIIDIPDELWNLITKFIGGDKLIANYNTVVPIVCKEFLQDLNLTGIRPCIGAFRKIYADKKNI